MISARKIALFAVVAAQASALADGEKTDKDLQKSVVPYGLIQGYSNVVDTQAPGTPDFQLANVRFGLKVSEGITRAQFETQIFGNLSAADAASATYNGVGIRRADVGLALPSNTTFSLGRTRLGGADAWGMDATTTVDQFSWIDGASVVQKVALGGKDDLTLALGVGNSMGFPGGKDSHTFGKTLKTDRGVIAGAKLNILGLAAAAYYGMEKNQIQQEDAAEQAVLNSEGKPIGANKDAQGNTIPDTFVKLKKVTTARDVSHFECSLGYNRDNWAVGGWYQSVVKSGVNVATISNGQVTANAATDADAKFGAKPESKTTATVVGVGFNGDSQLFGVGNLLQKGDLITYGASTSVVSKRGTPQDSSGNDISQYVVGVGYAAGGFQLELGHDLSVAENKVFTNKNGESVNNSSNRTYLFGIYSF